MLHFLDAGEEPLKDLKTTNFIWDVDGYFYSVAFVSIL